MSDKPKIKICVGSSCFARGNDANVNTVEKFLAEHHLEDGVDLELEGCLCLAECSEGPNVVINGVTYHRVVDGLMLDLLKKTFPQA
ncbi:MAG: (2Fe-2S) ferredoxin domain-containing protein [Victivallaceae bacterium]|nr:(2Fe-2S) ferredoxin domain-containing protein [Victivallaceae bacterium]